MKVILREVSLMNFILRIWSKGRRKWFTRSIIDELQACETQGDQMEGESGVSRSIIDQLHSCDIQGDEMEGESCVTRSIIDVLHSWVI